MRLPSSTLLGADAPGWAAPAHTTSKMGVWDHLKAAASKVTPSGDTIKTVAPVVASYFNAQAARADARAASANLLPRSMTDKSTLMNVGGPIVLGFGVLAAVVLVGSLSKKSRRR